MNRRCLMASWKEESRGKEVGVLGAVSGAVRELLRSSLIGWEYHAHWGRGSSCVCTPSLALLGTMSEFPCREMSLVFGLSSSPFMEWGTTIAFQHCAPQCHPHFSKLCSSIFKRQAGLVLLSTHSFLALGLAWQLSSLFSINIPHQINCSFFS